MHNLNKSAKILGVNVQQIAQMVKDGQLKTIEKNGEIFVTDNSLADYTEQQIINRYESLDHLSIDDILAGL